MPLNQIPGLGAFLERRKQIQDEDAGELQQASGLMGLQQMMEKRKQEQQYRQALGTLPSNATEEQLLRVARPYMGADALSKMITSSQDRKATIDAATINRKATIDAATINRKAIREQQIHSLQIRGEQEIVKIREAAAQQRITREESDRREAAMRGNIARLIASLRPSSAPSISEIVDPNNSAQMLRIDTRLYKGGSLGAPGVIGISGKEPTAAKREEKEGQGKELLKTELDNMRAHYLVLNESRAIPSSERGAASNTAAWVQGSTVGQLGGRIIGTKEQDARNQIQSGRLRIMNAIKNATGMSAQMLNSNIELKTWLDSLTSLTGSYESNIGIINSIENAFLKDKPKGSAAPSARDVRIVDW